MKKTAARIAAALLQVARPRRRWHPQDGEAPGSAAGGGRQARAERVAAAGETPPGAGMDRDTSSWVGAATDATDDPNATVPQPTGAGEPRQAGESEGAGLPGAAGASAGFAQRYRRFELLGEGGMGAVYRAEDTRLGRIVALKILTPALTANRHARQRFFLEARAVSALDHPNICTIYEIEKTAETPAGQLCLVMAYYDGETLKSRLGGGPLPVAEALQLARQVVRGLAKAHSQGIVHCDVKPANLMLTRDGVVKILDFGIARLVGQDGGGDAPGFGTPAYRSPEQARGEEVGPASDVWSLGVVLHEILTGRPPRRGPRGEPLPWEELDPITRLRPEVPPELDRILSRMLAADPADRYVHAAELLADLERVEKRIGGAVPPRRHASLRRPMPFVILGAGVCLMILWGYLVQRPSPSRVTFHRLTDFPGLEWYPSLSADGEVVVYARSVAGRSHIYRQRVSDGAAIDLTSGSPADDTQPAFSPDARTIAFRSERAGGGIFLMDAAGGAVRRLTRLGFNPSWSPDGRYILCGTESVIDPRLRRTESAIWRVEVATGALLRVIEGDAVQPSWSPHAARIAYWGVLAATGQRVIWTVAAAGGEAVPAVQDGHIDWNPVWSPDGRYLYFVSDRSGVANLWRVPIDEGSGRVLSEPEQVANSPQPAMFLSISRDGRRIAYANAEARTSLERVRFNAATGEAAGAAVAIMQTAGEIHSLDVSPDGGRLVYRLAIPHEALAIRPIDGNVVVRLLDDEFRNRMPRWSPDGLRIAFYSNRGGGIEIWTIRPDGSGLQPATAIAGKPVESPVWSPDGTRLAVAVGGQGALIDLTRPVAQRRAQLLPRPAAGEVFVADSWSGGWLAGAAYRPDGWRFPGIVLYSPAANRYVRLTETGAFPYLLHDGRRLLYEEGDDIRFLELPSKRSRLVVSPARGSSYSGFRLSPDEDLLYLAREEAEGNIWLLTMPPAP